MENLKDSQHIFRVDRFKVPAAARAEFVEKSLQRTSACVNCRVMSMISSSKNQATRTS